MTVATSGQAPPAMPRQTWRALLSKHVLYLPLQRWRGEPVLEHLADLNRMQWLSREQLLEEQSSRLRDLVRHAAKHIPHYREAFRAHGVDPESIRGVEDLPRLPLLEKATVRANASRLITENTSARLGPRKTSGSTGIPVPITKSLETYARIRAIWYRYLAWYGIDIGDRQGRFLGHPVTWKGVLREDIQDLILNKYRLDPVYLTPDRMRSYWKKVQRKPLTHIYGYPSAMLAFARFLLSEGEDPKRCGARALVCTGETLYPFQKQALEDAFGIPVVNEYGCTEAGILAFPCPEYGRMHVSADNVIFECVVGDRPAAPGEVGEVVLTELYSRDVPLIRYRLGDLAVPGDGTPCPCGRGLPTIERIEGRTSQMIQMPDGRQIHSEVFSYLSDAIAEIEPALECFRVRKAGPVAFVIQLVSGSMISPRSLEKIRRLALRILGENVEVQVDQVMELPRDPSGKLRYFVLDEAPPSGPSERR